MSSDRPGRAALFAALKGELRKISAHAVLFSQAVAERLGMHPTDLECLGIIAEMGPLTPGRLAELTGLTTGAITGLVTGSSGPVLCGACRTHTHTATRSSP